MTDYEEKLSEARKRGSPYDTAAKNEAWKVLEDNLTELAFYVNKVAKGNLATMLSSGFPVSKYRNSVLSPDIVRNLIVTDGRHKGEMVLSVANYSFVLMQSICKSLLHSRSTLDVLRNGQLKYNSNLNFFGVSY